MSSNPPSWRLSLAGAAMVFASASAALESLGCVPERERQEPRPGLECHDEERCGDHLVCYYDRCHQPCTMDRQCAEPLECIDEVCQ